MQFLFNKSCDGFTHPFRSPSCFRRISSHHRHNAQICALDLLIPFQLVEHNIAQQRTQRTTLRRALLAHLKHPFVHHTTAKILVDKTDYTAVFYRATEYLHELAVTYRVEEALKVKVYHIMVPLADYLPRLTLRLVAAALGTEAEAVLVELTLIDGGKYLVDCLLDKAVNDCRYAQQPHLAVVLGYLYPQTGFGR